ncbi:patatin [Azospirillum brasilense]|nr:patatin [Azospirillum brasilense]
MPAAFLATLEERTGKKIVDHFDLIVGTSTGGIIAVGLGLGLSAGEILHFYKERGPGIFGQPHGEAIDFFDRMARYARRKWAFARNLFKPKYDAKRLRTALLEVLGPRRLGESRTRLVIPAYDADRRAPYVFKTAHHDRFKADYKVSVVDVAMATAAAPSYFQAHRSDLASGLIDGGVWANNPMGTAALEAAAILRWDMDNTRMLSLGCTEEFITIPERGGLAALARDQLALKMLFQGQSHSAEATAKLLLGHPHTNPCLKRINVTVPSGYAAMDDASRIESLAAMGYAEAREHAPEIERIFFTEPRRPFVPCHALEALAA